MRTVVGIQRHLGVGVVVALCIGSVAAAGPTVQGGGADVSVTMAVHHDGRYSDPGPLYEGPPKIPDEIWFVFDMRNDGPNATRIRFRYHADTFKQRSPGRGGYNYWTLPMQREALWGQGTSDDCNARGCDIRLGVNQTYRFMVWARANAPGPFSIYGAIEGEASDPDPNNNRTQTFDKRVTCKINGTDGRDRLVATDEPDSICGRGGPDRLLAVGKDDIIFGQGGNDVLSGDTGTNQRLIGGKGFDTVTFARFPKAVSASLRDRTGGGKGLIQLEALIGSRFGDYLTGLLGRDVIVGGAGDDRIAGRSGNDRAFGGKGNDRFIKVDGMYDVVRGGGGNDVCQCDSGDSVRSASRVSYAPFYLDP